MINKKCEKSQKRVNSEIVQNYKQLMTRSRSLTQTLNDISGPKQTKTDSKTTENKRNKCPINKKIKEKNKSKQLKSIVKCLRISPKKEIKNNYNKCSKSSKIKEVVKKVKTKAGEKVKDVVKRELRNKCKNNLLNESTMKYIENNTNKCLKQTFDTIVSNRDNEKHNHKNVCQNSTKTNLCSKLFPTFNCIKSSKSSKSCKKLNSKLNSKPKNSDSKTKSNKINNKIDLKNIKREQNKKSSKTKPKTKSKKVLKSFNTKNKSKTKSNSKQMKKNIKNANQKVIKNSCYKSKKTSKVKTKSTDNDKQKKPKSESTLRRGHRLASLNACAKVRLLCENESERNDANEDSDESDFNGMVKKGKSDQKVETKGKNKKVEKPKKGRNECKALVVVDNSKKALAVRKRKAFDDGIEIIDTRSCKRMASLNASAIMAASYSPERVKRSKSVESNHSNSSVEMVREMKTISQTVSRFEISPHMNAINGVHVNHISQQKHETIETVKQLKISNKIKDRLLGIARLERQESNKQRKRAQKSQNVSNDNQNLISGGEMSGFQTKVQVTKVTHINTSNTSQGVNRVDKEKTKNKKSGHQIDSILERDSSVVHKYQVQSTIEMQTTFNSSNGSAIANVSTITAPQQKPSANVGPQMQVHVSGTPAAQVFSAPILSTPHSGQPTYYNFAGAAPILQVHNNQYQAIASSTPTLNSMPIINLSEPYPTHYSSAFSVPHFATHTHPTQPPFNYFHTGLYQPAGPLLQPFQDPCLIHKPIPFHPPSPQINHIHNSPQFQTLPPQSTQTFQNDMTQAFHPNTHYFHPFPTPMRPPQTVFFQAVPQTNGPNATTFTLVNPGLHYAHPTVINNEHFPTNESQILTNEMSYVNPKPNPNITTSSSAAQTSNDNNSRHISIQCSPQNSQPFQSIPENQFYDTNSSVRMNHNTNKTPVLSVSPQVTKKSNKSDNKSERNRKKSLLLKPDLNRQIDDMVVIRDDYLQTCDTGAGHESQVSALKSQTNHSLMPSNLNKNNSLNQKNLRTVCVQISTSLPSQSVPSMPSMPTTPSPSLRLLPLKKQNKKRFSHGWQWEGLPTERYVYLNNEEQSYLRKCYPAIRHNEGDVIRVRDCVLLRSGPRKTDLPFVAKISALWESPEGEMIMSLLWYYRPEHTDLEDYSNEMVAEIFASKHRDVNSVACIDDKCYVLTYNEFCRYKRQQLLKQSPLSTSITSTIVPESEELYPRADRMPSTRVLSELVFCCRKVYDYRQKRILKNPI